MPIPPPEEALEEFMTRAVAQVIVRDDLAASLRSGERRLRVKQGFDPTSRNLHLGHAVPLRKLRTLASWGHEIVLIVGDWTTQIGDPTDRDVTRPMKSREEVLANAQTYLEQFHMIVPRENTRVVFQDEWFGRFGLRDVIELASRFTAQQMLAREEFRKRLDAKTPIPIKDLLYPLLQAYDSVAIEADVEVGGTDQLFNILAGRQLQEQVGQRAQHVFITELLEGTDGQQMSKTKPATGIWLTDTPHEVFGKVMSLRDELMPHYFEWATELPLPEVRATLDALARRDLHPREAKERLARRIVTELHSAAAAEEAAAAFARQFREGQAPEDMPVIRLSGVSAASSAVDVLTGGGFASSRSEALRLIDQYGVRFNGQILMSNVPVSTVAPSAGPTEPLVVQVGRRRFGRVYLLG